MSCCDRHSRLTCTCSRKATPSQDSSSGPSCLSSSNPPTTSTASAGRIRGACAVPPSCSPWSLQPVPASIWRQLPHRLVHSYAGRAAGVLGWAAGQRSCLCASPSSDGGALQSHLRIALFRRSVMGPFAAVCGGAEANAGSEALRQVADGCVEIARAGWAGGRALGRTHGARVSRLGRCQLGAQSVSAGTHVHDVCMRVMALHRPSPGQGSRPYACTQQSQGPSAH